MANLRRILPLVFALCAAAAVHNFYEGSCPRKVPPPGVLVLPPGSELLLSCGGEVTVNGAPVKLTWRAGGSSSPTSTPVSVSHTSKSGGVSSDPSTPDGGDLGASLGAPLPPTTSLGPGEEETEGQDEDGVVRERGCSSSEPLWFLDGGKVEWRPSDRGGDRLTLSSVTHKDSGNYSCYHGHRQTFSIKVLVAEPPETPTLSCYKRSPSSKIRCNWTPVKPMNLRPSCSLLLRRNNMAPFLRIQCSYSTQKMRCWCTIVHEEEHLRTVLMAYLCVTSIAGNATSPLLSFIPLHILTPDPPAAVTVRQEEGNKRRMVVSWSFPESWLSHDRYYHLIYELKYRPTQSSGAHAQMVEIRERSGRTYTITDALSGMEYEIQLRAKDEFDGQWSVWSAPLYARSWTEPRTLVSPDDERTTAFVLYESSGEEDSTISAEVVTSTSALASHHILWTCSLFIVSLAILAAFIFRHKEKFASKVCSLGVLSPCGASPPPPPPSAPAAPEGRALVTFAPPRHQEPHDSAAEEEEEVEKEEEPPGIQRAEAMNFSNTSYFLIPRQL